MNNDEWGNIGPDSIHDPKWAKKKTVAEKEWFRQSSLQRNADPEFMKRLNKLNRDPAKRKHASKTSK